MGKNGKSDSVTLKNSTEFFKLDFRKILCYDFKQNNKYTLHIFFI